MSQPPPKRKQFTRRGCIIMIILLLIAIFVVFITPESPSQIAKGQTRTAESSFAAQTAAATP